MLVDPDALRKLAEALNAALVPAPGTRMSDVMAALHIARSEYLAAVTPSAILSLLNERAQLLTIAERAAGDAGGGQTSDGSHGRFCPRELHVGRVDGGAELDAALREIDL